MAKHIRQKDMPDVTPVSNTHRNDAIKDSRAFKEHYDPFVDPFNDEEEFARFQEAEAERTRRIVLIVILLFIIGIIVLGFFLGDLLLEVAGS